MAQVMLKALNKKYDEVHAVKDVNLHIRDKEFMVLVGPSGCVSPPPCGWCRGSRSSPARSHRFGWSTNAPKYRDIAMVFHNYALYPHCRVRHMAFG